MNKLKTTLMLALFLISFSLGSAAIYEWTGEVPEQVEDNQNPEDYCPTAETDSPENFEEYCKEIEPGWNDVLINADDDFQGLDNILTLTRKALNNDADGEEGPLTFQETNMILSLTSCRSSGVKTVGDCMQERGSGFGVNPDSLANPSNFYRISNAGESPEGDDDPTNDTKDVEDGETDVCGNENSILFATDKTDDLVNEIEDASWLGNGKFIFFYGDSKSSGEYVAEGSTMTVTLEGEYEDERLAERTLNLDYAHMTIPQYKENLFEEWNLGSQFPYQGVESFKVKFESGDSDCAYDKSFDYSGGSLSSYEEDGGGTDYEVIDEEEEISFTDESSANLVDEDAVDEGTYTLTYQINKEKVSSEDYNLQNWEDDGYRHVFRFRFKTADNNWNSEICDIGTDSCKVSADEVLSVGGETDGEEKTAKVNVEYVHGYKQQGAAYADEDYTYETLESTEYSYNIRNTCELLYRSTYDCTP